MPLGTIVLLILTLLLLGAIPTGFFNRAWGYAPGGTVGLVLAILLALLFMGKI